jgi:hypothetical protein
LWTRRRRAILAAVLAFALYAAFAALLLARWHFDPSVLVVAGDEFTNQVAAPKNLLVASHSSGYDGQFYFRLAIAPFSAQESVAGVHFDYPVYRAQRILYPMLSYLVSGGRASALPWSMIAVNLLAAGMVGGLAALVFERFQGASVLLAVVIALYPGFLLTMSRDLTELVEISLVLGGIALILMRRDRLAVVIFAVAVLAKEMALIVPIAILLHRAITKRLKASDALFLVPVAVFVGWKVYLFHLWHLPLSLGTDGHFSLPFAGMWQCIRSVAAAPHGQTLLIIELLAIIAFTIATAIALRTSSTPAFLKIACVLYALLFFSLGAEFWTEDWAFLRAATDYGVLGAIVALQSPLRRVVIVLFLGGWIGLGVHCVMFR